MKHFKKSEFNCPCCGENHMRQETIERFDLAREISGIPYKINSGWRCPKHNKEVGGSDTSSHPKGLAADIGYDGSGRHRYLIVEGLIGAGFTRIGIAKTFIHADDDEDKPQEVMWLY